MTIRDRKSTPSDISRPISPSHHRSCRCNGAIFYRSAHQTTRRPYRRCSMLVNAFFSVQNYDKTFPAGECTGQLSLYLTPSNILTVQVKTVRISLDNVRVNVFFDCVAMKHVRAHSLSSYWAVISIFLYRTFSHNLARCQTSCRNTPL